MLGVYQCISSQVFAPHRDKGDSHNLICCVHQCSFRVVIWVVGFNPFLSYSLCAVPRKETGFTAITSVSWKFDSTWKRNWMFGDFAKVPHLYHFPTKTQLFQPGRNKWLTWACLFWYFIKNCILGSEWWTYTYIIGSEGLYLQTECFRQSLLHNTSSEWLFSSDHNTPTQKLFQLKWHSHTSNFWKMYWKLHKKGPFYVPLGEVSYWIKRKTKSLLKDLSVYFGEVW